MSMETSPPKGFFPPLVWLVFAGALFCSGRGNIALILDTEWKRRAEAIVRGDPLKHFFLIFFLSFFIFLPFFCMQYAIWVRSLTTPSPGKKKKYIYPSNFVPACLLFQLLLAIISFFLINKPGVLCSLLYVGGSLAIYFRLTHFKGFRV